MLLHQSCPCPLGQRRAPRKAAAGSPRCLRRFSLWQPAGEKRPAGLCPSPLPDAQHLEATARAEVCLGRHPALVGRSRRGADLRTDNVARDNELDAPVLLPAGGGVIGGHGLSFAKTS